MRCLNQFQIPHFWGKLDKTSIDKKNKWVFLDYHFIDLMQVRLNTLTGGFQKLIEEAIQPKRFTSYITINALFTSCRVNSLWRIFLFLQEDSLMNKVNACLHTYPSIIYHSLGLKNIKVSVNKFPLDPLQAYYPPWWCLHGSNIFKGILYH